MRPGVLDPDQYAARPRSRRGASTSRLHRAADIIGPFPDRNGSMTRPSSLDRDQLLACGRGEMFGPGNARLPLPPMLMFDRITQIASEGGAFGKGLIRAELDINPDLWFFSCHFEGDPVMPGCLGMDAMWQLTGFYLPWLGEPGRGRALGVGPVKFRGQVLPAATPVRYSIDLRRVMRGKLALVIADGRPLVDEIGRPSCREQVCPLRYSPVVAD